MASTNPATILESNSKTDNFLRLIRLLIKGGRGVLQILFDSFISPAQLPTKLASQERMLHHSNFFRDQLQILYPGAGRYGESKNFDITLLSRLLQMICPLPTPLRGWKDPPNDADTSVEADFVRIKIYRNTIYAHNTEMELDDGTFQDLWRKISDVLIRIASHVSEEDGNKWKKAIADFENEGLTEADQQRYKQALDLWYKCDEKLQEISDSLKEVHSSVKDINEQVKEMKSTVQDSSEQVKGIKSDMSDLTKYFKDQKKPHAQQNINVTINVDICSLKSCFSRLMGKAHPALHLQEPETEAMTITRDIATTELKTRLFREELEKQGFKVVDEKLGSLITTVQCGSLQILQRFWEEYTSGRLNKMAEKCLVTQELLDRFGLEEVRLCTKVGLAEYKRSRRELIRLELDDKVYPDLKDIVGNVEVLIDEGNLPKALKLISDKKTEQVFEPGPLSILKFLVDSGAEVGHKTKDGTFPLMIASYQGSTDSVKYLLKSADVNEVDKFDRTALHVASWYGHVDVATVLIQHGASLNPKDKFGNTPLQLANQRSKEEVEKLLLKCGAKNCYEPMTLKRLASGALVKINDTLGYNLMHRACMTGDAGFVLHTLDKEKIDFESLSELHKAVQRGDVEEVVSLVVDQSMNIDTPANRRETALHCASVNGSMEVMETLLELGADISAQTDEGLTALHKACLPDNFSVASVLTRGTSASKGNYEGSTSLHIVARENVVRIAKLLLNHGASLTKRDNKGQTPLHIAARENVVHIAELLLNQGARLTERDNKEQTPLHIAAQLGQNEVLKLFLEKDMNPDLQDSTGCTPLHRAAENNHFTVTEVLITHKANPHAEDNSGQIPLHLSAAKGHDKVLEILLANKDLDIIRQVNHKDKMGFTPLHRAAENNKIAVAKTLISHKAAVNEQTKQNLAERIYLVYGQCEGKPSWVYIFVHNFKLAQFEKMAKKESISEIDFSEFGQEILSGYGDKPRDDLRISIENEASDLVLNEPNETPLHLACKMGHNEIVRLLHEANEDLVYQRDADGFLPFHTAIMYGHVETVQLLLSYSPSLTEESVPVSSAGESQPVTKTPVDLAAANDVNMERILKPQKEAIGYAADVTKISKMPKSICKVVTKEGEFLSKKFEHIYTSLRGKQSEEIDFHKFHPKLIM